VSFSARVSLVLTSLPKYILTGKMKSETREALIMKLMNMAAAFYTPGRRGWTVAAGKLDTCGGGI